MAQHFKHPIVWQKALDLVTHVYRVTEAFPKREVYSLTDQIRLAAISVPSNIQQGQAHFSKPEFLHFPHHSNGSLAELETQILIAERLEYTEQSEVEALLAQVVEVGKLLNGLINSLQKQLLGPGYWQVGTGKA